TLVNGQDIEGFEKDQLELLNILTQAEEVNLRKVKVPISISKIIRLRLGDALQFVIYHNERHMQQAINIIENKSFPKN
ncbi:MAG: DinB family protein, partial [Flavobacteriia bacterium]